MKILREQISFNSCHCARSGNRGHCTVIKHELKYMHPDFTPVSCKLPEKNSFSHMEVLSSTILLFIFLTFS